MVMVNSIFYVLKGTITYGDPPTRIACQGGGESWTAQLLHVPSAARALMTGLPWAIQYWVAVKELILSY